MSDERDCTRPPSGRLVFLGLLVALAVLPLAYDRSARDPYTTTKKVTLGVAMTGLLAVAWLGRVRRGIDCGLWQCCLAALAVAGVASAAFAPSPILAIEGLWELCSLALPAAVLGSLALRKPRRILLCADALALAGLVVAVVGILQHQRIDWWGFRESADAARGETMPPSPDLLAMPLFAALARGLFAALDGLSRPGAWFSWAGPAEHLLSGFFASRPFARLPTQDGPASVFGHPNVAAEFVAMGLAALLVTGRAAWSRGRALVARITAVVLRAAAGAVMAFYLVATGTRGAWVALLAALLVLATAFVLQAPCGRRTRRLLGTAGAGAALAGLALLLGWNTLVAGRGGGAPETPLARIVALFEKPADPARDTIAERRVLWANTRAMLDPAQGASLCSAALGVGPMNWQVAYPLHHRSAARHALGTYTLQRYPDHPHQDALEFLAEYGLLGVALASVVLATAAAALLRRMGRAGGEDRYAALALVAILTVVGTASMFSFPLHLGPTLVAAALACGAALAPLEAGTREGRVSARVLPVMLAGILVGGFAALAGVRAGAACAAGAGVACGALAAATRRSATATCLGGGTAFAAAAAFGPLSGAIGALDAGVAIAGAAAAAVAALPLERAIVLGPRASRFAAGTAVAVAAVAVLFASARLEASEHLAAGGENALGARFIPGDRERAAVRARDAYDRATAGNPAAFLAEMGRAGFLEERRLLDDAEASARRALLIHPRLINARVGLARIDLARGDEAGAMEEARAARGLNPDAVEPHLLLGELFARQGRDELAAAELEKAVALAPKGGQAAARVAAAEIYLTRGRELARALRHLDQAELEAAHDPSLLGRIAALYSAPGAPPEFLAKADALWRRVLALNPLDARARMRVAVAPLLSSEPAPAEIERIVETLDSLIRSNPNFEPGRVRYFRALALERLGRKDEAQRAWRDLALLTGVAPFRSRADDAELDAAIEALRALQAERPASASRPDSSPGGPESR